MIANILTLSSFAFGTGGAFGNLLFYLDQNGVFAYGLPFLMIFALVFGILSKVNILGKNKAINVIVSLVVGLMAIQLNFVSYFFSQIFPRLGVLLSILLTAIIVVTPFLPKTKKKKVHPALTTIGIIGAIGAIIIVIQSLGNTGSWFTQIGSTWGFTYWFQTYGLVTLFWIIFIGLFFIVIFYGNNGKKRNIFGYKRRKKK